MSHVPRRDGNRPKFRSGVTSAAEIQASIASSGIPDDGPTTGTKPLRPKAIDDVKKITSKRWKNQYGKNYG